MWAWLLTASIISGMVVALIAVERAWVHSSRLGGYHVSHGPDGVERGPVVPEDDDARWDWSKRRDR